MTFKKNLTLLLFMTVTSDQRSHLISTLYTVYLLLIIVLLRLVQKCYIMYLLSSILLLAILSQYHVMTNDVV